MQSGNLLNINLTRTAEVSERHEIELTDRFFANLEQEEISGGEVHATIVVRASAADIYHVTIDVNGKVTVPCDRCLDPLDIEIEATETLRVKDADPDDSDGDEMLYLDAGKCCYDFSWQVYEIIATALPIQRIHAAGQCNEDVACYIMGDNEAAGSYENDGI